MDSKAKPVERKRNWFTHFWSIPLTSPKLKEDSNNLIEKMMAKIDKKYHRCFQKQEINKLHVTLCMLDLWEPEIRKKAVEICQDLNKEICRILDAGLILNLKEVGAFWDTTNPMNPKPTVIFLKVKQEDPCDTLNRISNLLITNMILKEIVPNDSNHLKNIYIEYNETLKMYIPSDYHMTLLWINQKESDALNIDKVLDEFKDFSFDPVEIKRIDISSMKENDSEGFYKALVSMSIQ